MNVTTIFLLGAAFGAEPMNQPGNKQAVALIRTIPRRDNINPGRSTAGTGFLVERDGTKRWMITCAHVVKNAAAIRVDFSNTEFVRVIAAYVDEAHDLALLKLDAEGPPKAVSFRIRTAELDDKTRDFNVIGFARGVGPAVTVVPAVLHERIDGRSVGLPAPDRALLDPR